ncbi:DNA polymerase III subunit epsilon [Acinetobacter nectaris]|uniref:DNA polymerase III subunit epsilon n=1 Tax=Acinetobacter nectaris TaxID=1219382 RepID=UPI001EFFCF17|nr:DNA polymerase III subunit epsilon [Acinetobacter nectaris]MCF8999798.1 DNA polymerase III subunit epsilon [Acinetobacter nectaris]MCF9026688.1 DNA polymerase III subunit epsilon [Acinetobacter nectaris]
MSQTITLYVDGACRGNPGLGGWGAYIITEQGEHKLSGGAKLTTNNRMELTAAIEGIQFCPIDAKLIIWTDSNYVKQGITEWIHNWKKKNWKDVKNPDLWQKLDATCQNREIEWNWIKGHAGHEGNEMADQLANRGADDFLKEQNEKQSEIDKKKIEDDWLFNDPFGLDIDEEHDTEAFENDDTHSTQGQENISAQGHPHIKITPAKVDLHGPRQLILDTETTGFYFQDGDRIIEVGAVEMINRKLTGSSIHIYINPEKPVGDSVEIHGITDEFLADKPKYQEISNVLFDYLKGAEIIAHNASFDMNFLDAEFERVKLPKLSNVCEVTDTLAMAKNKHPGQKNSLDTLVRRYEIPARDRTYHGALLDAEILADVYLAMTGGQVAFDMDALSQDNHSAGNNPNNIHIHADLPIIYALDAELEAHQKWIKTIAEKNGEPSIFEKLE